MKTEFKERSGGARISPEQIEKITNHFKLDRNSVWSGKYISDYLRNTLKIPAYRAYELMLGNRVFSRIWDGDNEYTFDGDFSLVNLISPYLTDKELREAVKAMLSVKQWWSSWTAAQYLNSKGLKIEHSKLKKQLMERCEEVDTTRKWNTYNLESFQ